MSAESEETVTETTTEEEQVAAPEESTASEEEQLNAADFPEPEAADDLPDVNPEENVELLKDVSLKARVELGRSEMYLKDIMRLAQGSVVELDKHSGDPLDIFVSGRLVARGEVLVLNDNFCVRITEILSPEDSFKLKTNS